MGAETLHCGAQASHCGGSSLWSEGSVGAAPRLQGTGSEIIAHRLSCSVACGISPDQGLKPYLLHWQADS